MHDEYVQRAAVLLDKGIRMFGLPTSGPVYDGNLRHLTEPALHDFRLRELPGYIGNAAYMQSARSILDIGCGPATMVFRALGLGHDAWGIDLDDDKIDLARFRVGAEGYPDAWRSRVIMADATDLPFDDQAFDLVSSWQVLEHIEALPQALFEAVRVTKKGGYLDLRAPDYRQSIDNHYAMPWPRFMPRAHALAWVEAMGRPADGVGTFFYVTLPQVRVILEALGCRIIAAELWQHDPGGKRPFDGNFGYDPIIFRSTADIGAVARQLLQFEREGRLPDMYSRPIEFVIIAQRY